MALSDVQICNMAIGHVGAGRISQVGEDSKEGRACEVIYAVLRDEVLEAAEWPFAQKRKALSRLSEAPAFGYDYQYQIPSDSLSPHTMQEAVDSDIEWIVEGDRLLTGSDTASLIYTYRVEDETLFSSSFTALFALRIAVDLAAIINKNKKLQRELWNLYMNRIPHYQAITASAGGNKVIKQPSSYTDSR